MRILEETPTTGDAINILHHKGKQNSEGVLKKLTRGNRRGEKTGRTELPLKYACPQTSTINQSGVVVFSPYCDRKTI